MKPDRLTFKIAVLIITLAAGLMNPGLALAQEGPEGGALGLARISYMTGDVLFNTGDSEEWGEAAPNYPLIDGDRLWVGDDSKLEVRFGTGETAWVNYESELDMLTLSRGNDGNAYQMGLPFGEASFNVKNFEVLGSVFQVDTPNASIRAYGKALFRVSSLNDGTTQVGVTTGSVEVETERGIANVHGGEMLEVTRDGRPRITDLPGTDDWDDWVDARLDRYRRQYRSERYLPRQMDDYAYEFDNNGRWVSYPQYGMVWVPNAAPGWSPYSNGRWIWSGWDYVWLGYDPWYAPFHYGSWSWTASLGWCWVPPLPAAAYWSPGYVGWVWDVDYVYWVPLAPGEIYYGYGYYGPRSVNIYNTTVIVNKNVYKNSDVRNGVVVVKRDGFLKGKVERVREEKVVRRFKEKIVRKEITREKIVREEVAFGAPPVKAIKPVRETRLPKPDKVVRADRLPKKVVEHKGFEKKRHVVRDKVKSAFEPAQKPRHMEKLERLSSPEFKREQARPKREKAIERSQPKQEKVIERARPKQEKSIERSQPKQDKAIERGRTKEEDRNGARRMDEGRRPEREVVREKSPASGTTPGTETEQGRENIRELRRSRDTGPDEPGGEVSAPEDRGGEGKAVREDRAKSKALKEKRAREKKLRDEELKGDEPVPVR